MTKNTSRFEGVADGLNNRLLFRLYQCANMMHKTGTKALESQRITTQQWAILGALTRPPFVAGVAVGDLAAFLLVSRQNLAGVLSRLEAQGHIERIVAKDDNRSRLIRLTVAGRKLWMQGMRPRISAYYKEALQGFSTDDKIHLIHYLSKMLGNFKNLDPDRGI